MLIRHASVAELRGMDDGQTHGSAVIDTYVG